MPGTVSEVSATLVVSTMRGAAPVSKTRSCSACDSRANSGRISTPGGWCLRSSSAASRISRSPGRNTSTSPGPGAPQLVDGVGDGLVQAVLARLLERPPALLDREQPAADHDHRRRPLGRREVLREAVGVDRRRRDDHLQVGPARQDLAQVAEQEVDVEAALVRLVDDDRVVGPQQRIALRLGQQDAVGHQLDRGARLRSRSWKRTLVADDLAQRRVQLERDALGDARRGDPARLRVADQPAAVGAAAAELEHDLGQLRRLAGAGLAADDHDLVLARWRARCPRAGWRPAAIRGR